MPVGFLKNAQISVQGSYAASRLVWVGMPVLCAQKAQRDERCLTPGQAAGLHAFPWVLVSRLLVARGSHRSMQQVGEGMLASACR